MEQTIKMEVQLRGMTAICKSIRNFPYKLRTLPIYIKESISASFYFFYFLG